MKDKLPPFEFASIEMLHPYPHNARTHSNKQIGQIADSIKEFGFTNPILVDAEYQIIAGHGRVEAAKLLCMKVVPVLRIEHLTVAQKRAYILADNKIAENAGWDREILSLELGNLIALMPELDIEITGFAMPEIDILIGETADCDADEDKIPDVQVDVPAISRAGDLWQLGPHRLYCGDARNADAYQAVLGRKKAQMVFTDPPYNVPIDGHVSGLGKVKHREFSCAAGEMSKVQFTEFLGTVFSQMAASSCNGAMHFVCMDWRHLAEITAAGDSVYTELKNLCVWNKTNGGMGSLYRSKHELVFVFKHGTARHINNVELGRHGRYRTNVWDYAGANTFNAHRDEDLAMHPTVKPTALISDAILDCSNRGGLILDPFAGSGSTLIAAAKTGRAARLIELDAHYVDVIIRRYQAYSKSDAVHALTGESFDMTTEVRQAAQENEAGDDEK